MAREEEKEDEEDEDDEASEYEEYTGNSTGFANFFATVSCITN